MDESLSPAARATVERLRAAYADASRIDWPFDPNDVRAQSGDTRRYFTRHPMVAVALVAALIVAMFVVPLPHVSLINRLFTAPATQPPTATTVPKTSLPKTPPIGTQLAELGEHTVAGDHFGMSVAISGTTAVVGQADSVCVYLKTPTGWKLTANLRGSDTVRGDMFGESVATSGDTIVVGAPSAESAGRAYVFAQKGGAWKQEVELRGHGTAARDAFGSSVAISDGTIVVGSPDSDNKVGRAYVFAETKGEWRQQSELAPPVYDPPAPTLYGFGNSVTISGTTVAVGVDSHCGLGIVFAKKSDGWKQVDQLEVACHSDGYPAPDTSVAISGNTAILWNFVSGISVFSETAGFWAPTAVDCGGPSRPSAISGNTALLGVSVCTRSSGWGKVAELKGSDTVAGDEFGASVAISGTTALVGAPGHAHGAGRAYVFEA